jgi:hypothetical protein
MLEAFSAVSTHPNAFKAGKQAARRAIDQLSAPPAIIWAFASTRYDQQQLMDGIHCVSGGVPLLGCTTDGEVSTSGLSNDSLVVMALSSDRISFHTAAVEQLSRDSYAAGMRLAEQLRHIKFNYLQIFSDGLCGNATRIIEGIQKIAGHQVQIAGGTAGDGGLFQRTYQYFGRRVLSDSLVGVAWAGDFHMGTGISCGWTPVGIAKRVTRSVNNIVYELDGQPALHVYEKFLGKHASRLPAVGVEYPLGLLGPNGDVEQDGYFLCRATMGVDRDKGAIVFAGDVPEGALVKITMGSESDIIEAAGLAVQEGLAGLKKNNPAICPRAIFLFSCMARKIVLGSKTNKEILEVKRLAGEDVPIIGFYTYGEYAPIGKEKRSHFHNETITLSIVGD